MARESSSTFLLITDPAPIVTEFPILTGAIKTEFDPILQLFPMFVLFFLIPSIMSKIN